MTRRPVRNPSVGVWLRHAGRLIAASQRFLVLPIALATIGLLAALPAALAAGSTDTFSDYARYAVDLDTRVTDALRGAVDIDPDEWALLAACALLVVVAQAWLIGAFVRSLLDGQLRLWAGANAFRRLLVFYAGVSVVAYGLGVLADSGDGPQLVSLVAVLVLTIPVLFADYAIVVDDRGVLAAMGDSIAIARGAPRPALLAFWLTVLLGLVASALFDQQVRDAETVFPLFLVATALVRGLAAYVSDCALIALYLDARADDEVS